MNISEQVELSVHSTMGLGGKARYLAIAQTDQEIADLVVWAQRKSLKFLVIGQGSNIVWRDEGFAGLVIVNRIAGKKILDQDDRGVTVWLGGGENWDETVAWTVHQDLGGLELLSKIPGTVGAAPVQNIGAYGAELSDVLLEVQAYDSQTNSFGSIIKDDCAFGYRTSRFKKEDKGRFLITGITLKLHRKHPQPPFYESLDEYLQKQGISNPSREQIRDAVTAIRAIKLPDPSTVANNGSFFTNPIIEQSALDKLMQKYPDIKSWPMPDGQVKLAAGWLVEQAGFKDFHDNETGMATWHGSALVMVNEHAKNTADLIKFKEKIVSKVQGMFGITLEQEPELLP